MSSTAVLMLGGPTKGTRFRPLSLTVAKPLFPIAGKPLLVHPVLACKKIPDLLQVLLVGFYDERDMAVLDTAALSIALGVPVKYVNEGATGHGSAGAIYKFKDLLLQGNPSYIFVLNCDVCSSYPLSDLLAFHKSRGDQATATVLVHKVEHEEQAKDHGHVVLDDATGRVLHYAEKPETQVSDLVNCGIYVFSSPHVFDAVEAIASGQWSARDLAQLPRSLSEMQLYRDGGGKGESIRLGMPRVFAHLAERKQLFGFKNAGFWEVLKTPGMAIKFSALYLGEMGNALALARCKLQGGPIIEGNVYIHPDAQVHPEAKLGPNVAIEAGARIGAGCRLMDCIILDGVEVMAQAFIANAIVGWRSKIGPWARVQGLGDQAHKMGVTILGEGVEVGPEVVVSSSTILPHKDLKVSVCEEIVL